MEQDIQNKLEEQDKKLDAIFISVEKTRKYFLTIMWITIAMVILPLVGMVFVIPSFLKIYSGTLEGLL
jgi:uncharacterized membrane protein YjjP (DUF1212 family)